MQNVALDALLAGIASSCHVKVNPHVLEFDGDVPCMTSPISQTEFNPSSSSDDIIVTLGFHLRKQLIAMQYFIFVPMA